MTDAISLALVDNLDLAIARYTLPIADTDLLVTKAGGTPRGVATGLVQGTSGGGVGAESGAGAQGAGAGGTNCGAPGWRGARGGGWSGSLGPAARGPQPRQFRSLSYR